MTFQNAHIFVFDERRFIKLPIKALIPQYHDIKWSMNVYPDFVGNISWYEERDKTLWDTTRIWFNGKGLSNLVNEAILGKLFCILGKLFCVLWRSFCIWGILDGGGGVVVQFGSVSGPQLELQLRGNDGQLRTGGETKPRYMNWDLRYWDTRNLLWSLFKCARISCIGCESK